MRWTWLALVVLGRVIRFTGPKALDSFGNLHARATSPIVAVFMTSWCVHCEGLENLVKLTDQNVRHFLRIRNVTEPAEFLAALVVTDEVEDALATLPDLATRFGIDGYPTIVGLGSHGSRHVFSATRDPVTLAQFVLKTLYVAEMRVETAAELAAFRKRQEPALLVVSDSKAPGGAWDLARRGCGGLPLAFGPVTGAAPGLHFHSGGVNPKFASLPATALPGPDAANEVLVRAFCDRKTLEHPVPVQLFNPDDVKKYIGGAWPQVLVVAQVVDAEDVEGEDAEAQAAQLRKAVEPALGVLRAEMEKIRRLPNARDLLILLLPLGPAAALSKHRTAWAVLREEAGLGDCSHAFLGIEVFSHRWFPSKCFENSTERPDLASFAKDVATGLADARVPPASERLREVAGAGGPALVLATTNWCGHSLAAAELWAELERGALLPAGLRRAVVNGSDAVLPRVPAFLLYDGRSETPLEYHGEWNSEELVSWVQSQLSPPLVPGERRDRAEL